MSNIEIGNHHLPPPIAFDSLSLKPASTEKQATSSWEFFEVFVDQVRPFAEDVEKVVDADGHVSVSLTLRDMDVSFTYSSREIRDEAALSQVFNHDMAGIALQRFFLTNASAFTLQNLNWRTHSASISHQGIAAMVSLQDGAGNCRYVKDSALDASQLMRDFSTEWEKKRVVATELDGYQSEEMMTPAFPALNLPFTLSETLYLTMPSDLGGLTDLKV